MSRASITFVIPGYNAANYIGEAITSAQGQTDPADAIIVVDDGSRDATAAVARAAGATVIEQANGGPAAARNTGIRAAKTDWIALLDADDICYPSRLELQRPLLDIEGIGVVCARHVYLDWDIPVPPPELTFGALWEHNSVPTSTVILRKAAWQQMGGFNEARELIGVEDYNMWLRLAHAGWLIRCLPEALVEYRPTPASLTRQTARFAQAELANLADISRVLALPMETVRAREFKTYQQYGNEFFYYRDMKSARHYLAEAARRGTLDSKSQLRRLLSWLPLPKRPVA